MKAAAEFTSNLNKADRNKNNWDKPINKPAMEQMGNISNRTYRMYLPTYWSGPHFLFHINILINR